ncbi:MAG TPA: alpha/beta fold hydrolase [Pirellulales bacterium]|nr:alpha/beta fold hydrolase [Pirellulales bacterium]
MLALRSLAPAFRLLFALPLLAAPPDAAPANNHQRLLEYLDDGGQTRPVANREDWQRRRAQIIAGMEAAMGPLPKRDAHLPLDPQIEEVKEEEGYTRLKMTIAVANPPGEGEQAADDDNQHQDRLPLYLLLPKRPAGQRLPAMLALHQTVAIGKDEPVGLGNRVNLKYGQELARRGYVVAAPDYPSFGEYPYDFKKSGYASGTMKGIVNHMRAVDLLVSRPEVDAERIGVIGHSLGGHNSMFVGVFDQRLKVIVSSCGWTPFHDYYGGKIAGWTSDRYMPRLRDVYQLNPDRVPFDFYEVVAALAPRAFFSNSPLNDANFDVVGVRKAIAAVQPVYALFGAADRLQVRYPDSAHDFPPEVREEAYRFIDEVLREKSEK